MNFLVPTLYRQCLAAGLAAVLAGSCIGASPAKADSGGALAAGLLGGFAAGAIAGSAAARPYYYDYPPYYAPAPVYVPAPAPICWYEQRNVWDGYGYIVQPVRVCR